MQKTFRGAVLELLMFLFGLIFVISFCFWCAKALPPIFVENSATEGNYVLGQHVDSNITSVSLDWVETSDGTMLVLAGIWALSACAVAGCVVGAVRECATEMETGIRRKESMDNA